MAVGSGYTKLSETLTRSSVWIDPGSGELRPWDYRLAWVVLLAAVNRHGWVTEPIPVLAAQVGVTTARMAEIIAELEAPDEFSTDPENEGRRIERGVDGFGNRGIRLLNYEKYRQARHAEERRAYQREWKRERARAAVGAAVAINATLREPRPLKLKREKAEQAPLVPIQTAEEPEPWSAAYLELKASAFATVTTPRDRGDLGELKPLVEKHGWPPVKAALEAYIRDLARRGDGQFYSAGHFVRTFAQWARLASGAGAGQSGREAVEEILRAREK